MLVGIYREFGTAKDVLKIEEMEKPEPRAGQVRVKLFASGVNPSDYKMRLGSRPFTGTFQIPNSDGAGIVDEVGDGVSPTLVGKRVWVFNAAFHRPMGTSAQYTVVEEWMTQALPDNLTYSEGACLGIPVMTAYRCLFSDGSIKGQTIYVVGGAGVVAHYAIQIAKWAGATVITSVSSEEKAKCAKEAGADFVINYRSQNVAEEIMKFTNNQGVDRVIEVDFGANLETNSKILKNNGICSMYAFAGQPQLPMPIMPLMVKNITYKFTLVYSISEKDRAEVLSGIANWLSSSKPIFNIAKEFELNQIVQAHELVESGNKIGHVILKINH
jgi:NADPH2:quinone reductase